MSQPEDGKTVGAEIGRLLGGLFVRALEGASESVLDEVQGHVRTIDKRISDARKRVARRPAPGRSDEEESTPPPGVIDAEFVATEPRRKRR